MKLSKVQQQVEDFVQHKNIDTEVSMRIIDLVSEVGELSKEVLKGSDYGKKAFQKTEKWESEMGDVLFSLICIANQTETDLENCLQQVLHKYEQRFDATGDVGSGK